MANGLFLLAGREVATSMIRWGPPCMSNLSRAGVWLQRTMKRYTLQKPIIDSMSSINWIMQAPSGLFLVSLEGIDESNECINHTVLIDTGSQLVWDSMELHPLRLQLDVFEACVGNGVRFSSVTDIRKFCIQKVGRKPNKKCRKKREKKEHLPRYATAAFRHGSRKRMPSAIE